MTGYFAAIDLGASSGRVMLGAVSESAVELTEVRRFENNPVQLPDGLRWSITQLFDEAMRGVAAASKQCELQGVAVDSWAVDYGLLRDGALLGLPFCYRDERSERGLQMVEAQMPQAQMFARHGLQRMPFTTINQVVADRAAGRLRGADKLLLLPDLFNFWMTGKAFAERTNASTTGLVNLDGEWDAELLEKFELPAEIFPEFVDPGTCLGSIDPKIREHYGIVGDPQVYVVGSHDTASAVVAAPLATGAAYISSGTWSLVGVELEQPIATPEAGAKSFTNEGGVDDKIRFLQNVMGLWLLSESQRQWRKDGVEIDLQQLLRDAAAADPQPVFDATAEEFYAPGDMPGRIQKWLRERGLAVPQTPAEITRSILESLAAAYAAVVADIAELTGQPVTQINIVGGGSLNWLLCELTAKRTGLKVVAGPVEATALGNLLVQARAAGVVAGDLSVLRQISARSGESKAY